MNLRGKCVSAFTLCLTLGSINVPENEGVCSDGVLPGNGRVYYINHG